jgi:Flp pilus assembly protein TadD
MRNIALVAAARGHTVEGLMLLDSVLARARAEGGEQTEGWAYYSGQRVPLLIRVGRTAEAATIAGQADRIIRATTPTSHSYRADADMWVGEAAFAQGDAMTAAARFDSARVRLAPLLPPQDVRRAAAECSLGVALARLGRRAEALTELRSACVVYRNAAFADSVLVGWARAALAKLEGS